MCTSKLGDVVLRCINLSVRARSISLGICVITNIQQGKKKRINIPATKSFIVSNYLMFECAVVPVPGH